MEDFKNKSYVIMGFATIDGFYDKIKRRVVNLAKDEIIEVSAVKIENGKLKEYFNSFISIDGYDAHNIEFEGFRQLSYYADALHLIGAPNFEYIAKRLFDFIGQSIIINTVFTSNEAFKIFKEKAQSFGYVFNNSTSKLFNNYPTKDIFVVQNDDLKVAVNNLLGQDTIVLWTYHPTALRRLKLYSQAINDIAKIINK